MHRARLAILLAIASLLCAAPAFARPQFRSSGSHTIRRSIYPSPSLAHADLQSAIATARRQHKNVLLDFGANWCPDCVALDYYLHEQPNASMLARNFVLVHINVGRFNHNRDLARKYNIPLKKGIPALAVLNSHGRLLYSQTGGQFEDMHQMSPDSVTAFLNMWKPARSR